jgi:hypothetical protein
MINYEDVIKIGDKYYLTKDVQSVLEVRIQSVPESEIIIPEE